MKSTYKFIGAQADRFPDPVTEDDFLWSKRLLKYMSFAA